MASVEVLRGHDLVTIWIRVDRLMNRIVAQRLKEGATPESDEAFDRLILVHRWLARRLGN